jgi:hypothetical protein
MFSAQFAKVAIASSNVIPHIVPLETNSSVNVV